MKDKEFLFLSDDDIFIYSKQQKELCTNEEFQKTKNILLSDLNYDIKLISIPYTTEDDRRNIVINTIKKHSLIDVDKENIDYKVLYSDEIRLFTAVFIRKGSDIDIANKNKILAYQIPEYLVETGDYPPKVSFLMKYDRTNFLYYFENKHFVKRLIILDTDIDSILNNNDNIFIIDFSKEGYKENSKTIQEITINEIVSKVKEFHFKEADNTVFIRNIVISVLVFISLIIFTEYQINYRQERNKKLAIDIEQQRKILEKEKAKRGISDKLFKEYSFLLKNKSHLNEFFYLINEVGKNNIQIEGISFADNKFSIMGLCENDSDLEDSFRKSDYFKNISFSFSKKNEKLLFHIEGEYTGE